MRVHAFRGIRFGEAAGDPGRLAAPPYDQIGPELRDRLHETDHQFAHLSRPVAGEGLEAHPRAAHLHAQWLDGGILTHDPAVAVYPYAIEPAAGGRRLGICALLGLEPPESGVIRPHEKTVPKTVAERLGLLREMAVDIEPILVLAEDGGGLETLLASDCAHEALVRHRDLAGDTHLLWRVDEPQRVAAYRDLLAPSTGLIADGHHRYQVARNYAAEVGARPGTAAGAKLAVVTSLESPGLAIDPIHRGLAGAVDLSVVRTSARRTEAWSGDGGAALAARVGAARQPALGVWAGGGPAEVWELDPTGSRDGLTVSLLHEHLLPRLGLGPDSATDGTIVYRSDPDDLFSQVANSALAVGFWLPPMEPADFAAAVAGGRILPPKSTRFLPKVVSGMVWADHATPID